MPMQLLVRLCCTQLPNNIDDEDEIETCEVLRAAKLIEADIPPVFYHRGRATYSGQATVMCVTERGRAASEVRARVPDTSESYVPHPMKSAAPSEGHR